MHIKGRRQADVSVHEGKVTLTVEQPEAVLQWALLAERCQLPTLQVSANCHCHAVHAVPTGMLDEALIVF